MLAAAGIGPRSLGRSVPTLTATGPRTTEEIVFLVGAEAFEKHAAGFVTMRVPVVEFEGIDVDQVPLTDALGVIENGLDDPPVSDGVPIASVETIVMMKLLSGRTQDLADIEAIVDSGADRERLRSAVRATVPERSETLERLFGNVDCAR